MLSLVILRIVLEGAGEETAEKADGLIVVIAGISLLNGCVVFVNDDHCFLAVMLVKHRGQHCQRAGEQGLVCTSVNYGLIHPDLDCIAEAAAHQLLMTGEFVADNRIDLVQCTVPGCVLDVLE